MDKGDLITNKTLPTCKSMQLLEEQSKAYYNFIYSLHSESTKKAYKFCLENFLNHYQIDLLSFLRLPQDEMTSLIIRYLVDKKASRQYKNLITATLKHACEINDIVLNWKKIKKFISSDKSGNETNGRDRGYTHDEIQKILEFSDQRLRTAFLILASTGIRIGALRTLRVGDLEKIDDIYKVRVYSGDKEEYITFTTTECAKEIDTYLDFRARHGEKITDDSFLFVKKFDVTIGLTTGKQFSRTGIRNVLDEIIINCGLRQVNHTNQFKRQKIPLLHGFRKYFRTQLQESKVDVVVAEMLMGHNLGMVGTYSKPSIEYILNEYSRAIDNLTIDPANRLQRKVQTLTVEKSIIDSIASRLQELERKAK
jgi:integrase